MHVNVSSLAYVSFGVYIDAIFVKTYQLIITILLL